MANWEYTVSIRNHADAANGDFSPGDVIEQITHPTYLGWSEYVNEVGEAFFSMSQDDARTMRLSFYDFPNDILALRPHMEIYRNKVKVWGGWLGEIDETETDVIIYGYSYLSGFYDLLTPFVDKQIDVTVSSLVDGYFDQAIGKTGSRVHWLTKGTIQNPWTDDTQTLGITMPLYRTSYKRILVAFKELAAYAISDTQNKVIFEVNPSTTTFNFWRDRDSENNTHLTNFPYGQVRSYRRIRRPILRRSQLVGVGASPTAVLHNKTVQNSHIDTIGLSEEPILLAYVRDEDELERVLKSRAKRAGRVDGDFYISFFANTVVPYRAPVDEASFVLGQDISATLWRGTSWGDRETKVIVGQQVIWNRMSENVRLLLADDL